MKIPRVFINVALVAVLVGIVLVGYFTLLGNQVSEVFTEVNYGLSTDGGAMPPLPAAPAMDEAIESEEMAEQGAQADEATGNVPQQQIERLIIKNARMSLEVEDVRAAEEAVQTQVEQVGGYVVQVNTNGTGSDLTASITFRVPAERFDEVLEQLQGIAKQVLSRSVSGDDVTEEYVDLQSRLGNLQVTRDRLQELMDQAQTVEEALNVSRELSNIQGQIEQLQGRVEYLEQSAALSTVTVFLQTEPTDPIVRDDGWSPLSVARGALRTLVGIGQFLASVGIVLVVLIPAWLPLVLLGRWLWLKRKKPAPPDATRQSQS